MLKTLNANYFKTLKVAQSKGTWESVTASNDGDDYWMDDDYGDNLYCCGISELTFNDAHEYFMESDNLPNDLSFKQFISLRIKDFQDNLPKDDRVIITGLPLEVREDSMYNQDFYNNLYKVLMGFGFTELSKPYKNANSGNTIVALGVINANAV